MQLSALGWNPKFAAEFQPYASAGLVAGRIVQQFNHIYHVATARGEVQAQASGRLRYHSTRGELPVTGDWVALRLSSDGAAGLVIAVLPRTTKLSRTASGSCEHEQLLAANLDFAFLVSSLDNDFNPRRIERYLSATWGSGGAVPVVILNKLDLCHNVSERLRTVEDVAIGVPIHAVSALRGDGLEELTQYCVQGRTIALLGSSGVGKSTLINRLVGREAQDTYAVRQDGRGRHTTTRRELLLLPGGGVVIDTPGMRELQLWDGDEGVQRTFDEIETTGRDCRYRNCSHNGEPGCAVAEAMKAGTISAERLASFHKLQRELRFLDRRNDTAVELADKRRWKTIHKAAKLFMKHSPKRR